MNNWLKINQTLNFGSLSKRIFKQNCLMCAAPANNTLTLRQICIDSLPRAPSPSCQQCGLATQGELCGGCLNNPPHYDATTALFSYAYPADAILQHYKYNNALYLSQTFGHLLAEEIVPFNIDVIIPMPLHPSRLQERGFNQSLEVAKVIAKQLNLVIDATSCSKTKNTPPQASLPLKERLKNMKGAFSCQPLMAGKHVALIDDVMTTGASLNALAKTIKQAGAAKVSCYVLARTA